jgi:DHA1 family bicyclomycin/chloramphenicol resistance-like MFS transporter
MHFKPGTRALTVLLAFMTAIGPLSTDIYLASMPHIGEALTASTGAVQLTLSLYLVGFAVGQIVYGPFSDTYGRRPLLLIGFALYLVATFACAFTTSIEMLIGARMVQAIGGAGPIILARAIVRDLYQGSRAARQLSIMSTIMGITPIGAPVLGGFLQAWFGWRSSFVAMGLIGIVLALAALLFLPETNKRKLTEPLSFGSILGSFRIVFADKGFRSYLTIQAMGYAGLFAFLSGSSYVLQKVFGFTSVQFGFTFTLCSMSYISATTLGSRLISRMGLEGLIGVGMKFMLAGGILQVLGYLLLPGIFLALTIPQMLYFFGMGFMLPQTMAAGLTPFPDRAGAASSLMGFVQMTSAAIVGVLMASALDNTAWPLVIVMALAGVGAFTVFHLTAAVRPARTRSFH